MAEKTGALRCERAGDAVEKAGASESGQILNLGQEQDRQDWSAKKSAQPVQENRETTREAVGRRGHNVLIAVC